MTASKTHTSVYVAQIVTDSLGTIVFFVTETNLTCAPDFTDRLAQCPQHNALKILPRLTNISL